MYSTEEDQLSGFRRDPVIGPWTRVDFGIKRVRFERVRRWTQDQRRFTFPTRDCGIGVVRDSFIEHNQG